MFQTTNHSCIKLIQARSDYAILNGYSVIFPKHPAPCPVQPVAQASCAFGWPQ